MNFADVRAKYPQYDDLSDDQLSAALHKKFYADMPYEQFSQRVGLRPAVDQSVLDKFDAMKNRPPQEIPMLPGFQRRLNEMPSFVRAAVGTGEAGLQAATGLAGSVVGGIAGLADAGLSLSGAPGDTVRNIQQAATYSPRTSQGQTASRVLGLPMDIYSKGVGAVSNAVRGGDSGGARDFAGTTLGVGLESLPVVLGGLSALKSSVKSAPALSPAQEVLAAAQKEGFTIPPSQIGRSSVLEGVGGKIRTSQLHSANNAEVMTRIAPIELGLPEGTVMTPKVYDAYRRAQYDQGYLPIKQRQAPMQADGAYWTEVSKPAQEIQKVQASFPDAKVAGAAEIQSLADGMLNVNRLSYEAAVERIRQLRFEAKKNLNAFDDPAKSSLGHAQKAAAKSLEDLMERNLARTGDQAALTRFREARENIAKAHTLEDATNPATGAVSARDLGKSNAPLTGRLKTAADFAQAFPRAVQKPEVFGGTPPISPLDVSMGTIAGLGTAAITGNPLGALAAGLPLLRPMSAPLTKMSPVQRALVRNQRPLPPELGLLPLLDPEQQQLR